MTEIHYLWYYINKNNLYRKSSTKSSILLTGIHFL